MKDEKEDTYPIEERCQDRAPVEYVIIAKRRYAKELGDTGGEAKLKQRGSSDAQRPDTDRDDEN
jgi:hypothetical protein